MKQQSGRGVRCDIIFPYIHQHESEAKSQGEDFGTLFRDWKLKKKETEKRSSEYLYYSSRHFRCWKLFVWNRYKEKSLKESTREKRGTVQRQKVTNETKLPSKWKMFLQFFRTAVPQISKDATARNCCACSARSHHNKVHHQVLIRTVDIDIVVVIMIELFNELLSLHPCANVWISLGRGKALPACHLCISCSWYISSNAPVSFLYWFWETPPLASRAMDRNPLGKLKVGSCIVIQMRSFILLITHITTWIWSTATSSCLNVLLWVSMTRQTMKPP